jgi:hypothetical protein
MIFSWCALLREHTCDDFLDDIYFACKEDLILHRVEHVAIFGGLHLAPGVGWPSPVSPRGKMIRRSRSLDPNGCLAVQSGAPKHKLR